MSRPRKKLLPNASQTAENDGPDKTRGTDLTANTAYHGQVGREAGTSHVATLAAELDQIADLQELGARAQSECHQLDRINETRVEQQVRLAVTLARARDLCPPGEWKGWVEQNTGLKRDMADLYARAGRAVRDGQLDVVTITKRGISNAIRPQPNSLNAEKTGHKADCQRSTAGDKAQQSGRDDHVDAFVKTSLRAWKKVPPESAVDALSKFADAVAEAHRTQLASALFEQMQFEQEAEATLQRLSPEKRTNLRNALKNLDEWLE